MTEGIIQKTFNDVTKKTCGLEYSLLKYVERQLIENIQILKSKYNDPNSMSYGHDYLMWKELIGDNKEHCSKCGIEINEGDNSND